MNVRKNRPCPCGSGAKAKHCCHGSKQPMTLLTLPLAGDGWALEEVRPDQMEALKAAFAKAQDHRPGDDCPICALQRSWRERN
jgi:hypothetical protein